MANQDGKVDGTNKTEGAPEQNQAEQTTEVAVVKKSGIGTALKIGGGLLFGAAFTGLGWLLRGFFGGRDDDDEVAAAEAEHPEE